MDPLQPSALRDIILCTRKPLVLRKFCPNWKCFDCPIDKWARTFDAALPGEEKVLFEQMPTRFADYPQWERYRNTIGITIADFLDIHSKDIEKWFAFNYQRTEEMPEDCRYDVDFTCFGFSQASKESSFWLSSKGANTPCHYDTYGCNIVAQVYGSKHWLLFPPEAQLTPIRVPYEESSVYCSENFFSPQNLESVSVARQNAFECILGEGDVLIVPRNWWHYVESLEISLSVNAWIPLEVDLDAQIEEWIVKYIVEKSVAGESDEQKQYVLNPNQLELITSSEELFEILRVLLDHRSLNGKTMQSKLKSKKYPYEYLSEAEVNDLIDKSPYDAMVLKPLNPSEFDNLMRSRTSRYIDMSLPGAPKVNPMHEALLNAICHPTVIKVIKDKFLKTYSSSI